MTLIIPQPTYLLKNTQTQVKATPVPIMLVVVILLQSNAKSTSLIPLNFCL
jgi:hypothetical protein